MSRDITCVTASDYYSAVVGWQMSITNLQFAQPRREHDDGHAGDYDPGLRPLHETQQTQ